MNRFVTIDTYAKMCGILRTSVYKRLKSGKLSYSKYCEMPAIDLEEYPPNKFRCEVKEPVKKTMPSWMYD